MREKGRTSDLHDFANSEEINFRTVRSHPPKSAFSRSALAGNNFPAARATYFPGGGERAEYQI